MPGCKYRWLGDAPEVQEPTPTGTELVPATATFKLQTALPLRSVTVLWETFTPGDTPISLSLTYLSKAQILALHIPWEYQKARITVPARHTRILRDGEMCRIHLALEKCQFAIDVSGGGDAVWGDSKELKEWVVEEMEVWERDPEKFKADFKGYLEVVCHPVGGKREEEGSAEKMAHAFFEHIVQHSSGPRSKSLWESRCGGFWSGYHTGTRCDFRKDRPCTAPAIPAPTPARLPIEPARPVTSTNPINVTAFTPDAHKRHSGSYHFARPLGGYGNSSDQRVEAKFAGATDWRRVSTAAVDTTLPFSDSAANRNRILPTDPVPGTISGGKPRDFQPRGGFFGLLTRRSEDARYRPEMEDSGSRGTFGRGVHNDRGDRGGRGGRGVRGRGRGSFGWLEKRPRTAGN